mgnify:CR=1 FL=1
MESILFPLFHIAVLLAAVTIHELSHGLAANAMGDTTAKNLGRLTLNPIRHLDLFGSLILPLMLYLVGFPVFGYAKPVPYNPLNLNDQRWGPAKVALAGPASNVLLALLFGLVFRFLPDVFSSSLVPTLFVVIIYVNILLAVFNLFPIPPLDGHWILFSLLPRGWEWLKDVIYQYSIFLFVALIVFGGSWLSALTQTLFQWITGAQLPG